MISLTMLSSIAACFKVDSRTIRCRGSLALHARKVEVLNSFLEGGRSGGSDAQAIAGWNGKGPYLIHNNYIDGTTENILFGGATPFMDDSVQGAEIRYNYLPHPEERWRVVKWSPRLKVLAGRVVQATGSLALYISTTSGFTGASEPCGRRLQVKQ